MTSEHREDCISIKYAADFAADCAAYDDALGSYTQKWPDFCQDCGGWGGSVSYYDPSPPGVSLSPGSMMDYDPCPTCVEQDICPRCGQDNAIIFVDDDHCECSACSWVEGKTDGVPQDPPMPPECDCWEEDI